MQKLPDFVPAFSHHFKPPMRDGSQSTGMLFHPRLDGGIPLDSAIESQQFRSHRSSAFCFRDLSLGQQNPSTGTFRIVRDRLVGQPDDYPAVARAIFVTQDGSQNLRLLTQSAREKF
jgi:hypothetical protein